MDYPELLSTIQSRRSIRQFTQQPVAREDIIRLLEAARWAPSNHNRQGWKFLVYDNREKIAALGRAVQVALANRLKKLPESASSYSEGLVRYATFFEDAPVLVVALHKRPTGISAPLLRDIPNPVLVSGEALSTAMAVQNILLAAPAIGLGACVMTGPLLVPEIFGSLELPPGFDVNCFIAVGHPAESPTPPRRKPVDHIVEFRNAPPPPEAPFQAESL